MDESTPLQRSLVFNNATLNIYLYDDKKLFGILNSIISKLNKMDNTLDDVLQEVADEGTQIDSLAALVDGIEQQLKDALSGTTLPPAVQAKVDTVFTNIAANKQKVVDAINKNTPADPGTGDTGGGTGDTGGGDAGGGDTPTP